MKRLPAVALLGLMVVTIGFAQNDPVLLRYKFTSGQTDTYIMQGSGMMPVTIAPPPEGTFQGMGFNLAIEMNMTMQQKCTGVLEDGSGQVEMTIPALETRLKILQGEVPMEMITRWENGVLTNTANGEAVPEDENTRKLAQTLAATMRMTVKPTGEQIPDEETLKLMAGMYNASAFSGMDMSRVSALTSRLPDEAVAPGATWEVEDEVSAETMSFGGKSQMKFAGYEDLQGLRTARIEGSATMTMNGQAPTASALQGVSYNISMLEANILFVNHFDPVQGDVPLSQVNMAQNMIMMITMVGLTAGGPLIHLPTTIENGQMTMETRKQ